jgi:hypothetical protein
VALMHVRHRLRVKCTAAANCQVWPTAAFWWVQLAWMHSQQANTMQRHLDAGPADVWGVARKLRPLPHLPAEGLSSMAKTVLRGKDLYISNGTFQ